MKFKLLHQAFDSIQSLFFPPICLHCKETLQENVHILCNHCLDLLDFLSPRGRCPYCFQEIQKRYCTTCRREKKCVDYAAAVFDMKGPAKSLLNAFQTEKRFYLVKSIGAFFLLQHELLGWQQPDCIVAPPQSFFSFCIHGENPSHLIAKELAKLFQCSDKKTFQDKIVLLIDTQFPENSESHLYTFAQQIQNENPKQLYLLSFCISNAAELAINKTLL